MTSIHFLSFGDGSFDYRAAVRRIAREASREYSFASINAYNFLQLKNEFPDFWNQYRSFILSNKRGAGYWLWKPFIILEQLKRIGDNDVVLYADAGCEFRHGREFELANIVERTFDIAACELNAGDGHGWKDYNIETWTNAYTLKKMGCPACLLTLPQFSATLVFVRNTSASKSFISDWLHFATVDGCSCLIDRDTGNDSQAFKEHRHDQSIFSILARTYISESRLNISVVDGKFLESDTGFFIYAARNRGGYPSGLTRLSLRTLPHKLYRKIYNSSGFENFYRCRIA